MGRREKERPKQDARKDTKPTQAERFKEAARDLGADESGERFEEAFKKLVPPTRDRASS